jgi:copper chaperone CopZ
MTEKLIIIAGILLIAYAVYATVQKARGKSGSSCCGGPEAVLPKPVADTDESHYPYKYYVSIDGMMCSNCAAKVENAINKSGDVWANVDLGRKRAEVLSKSEKAEDDFAKALKGTEYKVTGYEQIKK